MLISIEEAKGYLRVDSGEDDALIESIITASEKLCADVARLDGEQLIAEKETIRIAILYAVAYLYDHREDADHKALTLSLRSLLFGVREEGF